MNECDVRGLAVKDIYIFIKILMLVFLFFAFSSVIIGIHLLQTSYTYDQNYYLDYKVNL